MVTIDTMTAMTAATTVVMTAGTIAVMTAATTAATTAASTTEIGRDSRIAKPGASAHSGRPPIHLRAHQLELRVTVSHTPRVTR